LECREEAYAGQTAFLADEFRQMRKRKDKDPSAGAFLGGGGAARLSTKATRKKTDVSRGGGKQLSRKIGTERKIS